MGWRGIGPVQTSRRVQAQGGFTEGGWSSKNSTCCSKGSSDSTWMLGPVPPSMTRHPELKMLGIGSNWENNFFQLSPCRQLGSSCSKTGLRRKKQIQFLSLWSAPLEWDCPWLSDDSVCWIFFAWSRKWAMVRKDFCVRCLNTFPFYANWATRLKWAQQILSDKTSLPSEPQMTLRCPQRQ